MRFEQAIEQARKDQTAEAAFLMATDQTILFVNGQETYEIDFLPAYQDKGEGKSMILPVRPEDFWDRRVPIPGVYDARPDENDAWEAVAKDYSNVPMWAKKLVRETIEPPENPSRTS